MNRNKIINWSAASVILGMFSIVGISDFYRSLARQKSDRQLRVIHLDNVRQDSGLSPAEDAELAELRARIAKEDVDNLGK